MTVMSSRRELHYTGENVVWGTNLSVGDLQCGMGNRFNSKVDRATDEQLDLLKALSILRNRTAWGGHKKENQKNHS